MIRFSGQTRSHSSRIFSFLIGSLSIFLTALLCQDSACAADAPTAAKKAQEKTQVYLDPEGKPMDVYQTDEKLKAADGEDDFDMFKSQGLQQKNAGPNLDQKAEEELAQLRQAEVAVEARKAKALEESERQKKLAEQADHRRNAAKAQKYRKEIKGQVDQIEGIGRPDVEWNGLD